MAEQMPSNKSNNRRASSQRAGSAATGGGGRRGVVDQFLKKLEVTKQPRRRKGSGGGHSGSKSTFSPATPTSAATASSSTSSASPTMTMMQSSSRASYRSDCSTCDSRNENDTAFADYSDDGDGAHGNDDERDDGRSYRHDVEDDDDNDEDDDDDFDALISRFDRRSFSDPSVTSPTPIITPTTPTTPTTPMSHDDTTNLALDPSVSQSNSASGSSATLQSKSLEEEVQGYANFVGGERGLPHAILRLDRRDAIPTPRHKNDVLLEIEACTVDRRDLMTRPGVRCTQSLPRGITTTSMDCVGRVVQLTTHARAIHGISLDDRVAALYPFEYNSGPRDEKVRRNRQYALVDAGYVVTVPRHVDAVDASCMVRLYLSAFQSIQKGMEETLLHYRYDTQQLKGKSILVENGETELGRALIEVLQLLGADRVFATGPAECHDLFREIGVLPLGTETFSWELFIEEKISLVLVQDTPTPENFEKFLSILDETKGNIVYIHNSQDHLDPDGDDLGIIAPDEVMSKCDGLHFHELAKRATSIMNNAKYSCILACSPQYTVYEGVWQSAKYNQVQFKEDLRYLLTVLGQGHLRPSVEEIIGLEEVAGVQDRIELLGKKGSIVCLPMALYSERKALASPWKSPLTDEGYAWTNNGDEVNDDGNGFGDPLFSYARDAGYFNASSRQHDKSTPGSDTLSDFNNLMQGKREDRNVAGGNILLPMLPEAEESSYSYLSNFVQDDIDEASNKRYQQIDTLHHNEAPSIASSMEDDVSRANQNAFSDVSLERDTANDPPQSVRFRPKKSMRRRMRAKERWVKSHQSKKRADTEPKQDEQLDESSLLSPGGSCQSQDLSVSTQYSARRMRRDARMRKQKNVASQSSPSSSIEYHQQQQQQQQHQLPESMNRSVQNLNDDAAGEDQIQVTNEHAKNDNTSSEESNQIKRIRSSKHESQKHLSSSTVAAMTRGERIKVMNRHAKRENTSGAIYDDIVLRDSRNEEDEQERDNSPSATEASDFNAVMSKWQTLDKNSRVM